MPYGCIDSNYILYRSTVVRAVKEMVWKSVEFRTHRFASCLGQELNQIRTVLLVIEIFFFRSCMRDRKLIGCFSYYCKKIRLIMAKRCVNPTYQRNICPSLYK